MDTRIFDSNIEISWVDYWCYNIVNITAIMINTDYQKIKFLYVTLSY